MLLFAVKKRESRPLMLNFLVKMFHKISQRIGWSVESLVEEIRTLSEMPKFEFPCYRPVRGSSWQWYGARGFPTRVPPRRNRDLRRTTAWADVESGPKDKMGGAFDVKAITGDNMGKTLCYV